MRLHEKRAASRRREGTALLYALVIAIVVAGMCVSLLGVNLTTGQARGQTQTMRHSFYAAEAGLSDAYMQMSAGLLEVPADGPAYLGTSDDPVPLGTSSYWVEVTEIDSRNYILTSTGIDGRSTQRLGLFLRPEPTGFFQFAAFGAQGVVLDSNAFVDSYDSARGSYESQVKTGNDFARENGNVGSNGDILLKSNTELHGDAIPGPTGIVDDSAPRVYVSGSTDPAEEEVEMPPIEVPDIPSSGFINGTSDVVLGPGPVHYEGVRMDGGTVLTIRGPATVVMDDLLMRSNSALVFDATGGPIEVYGTNDFVLESNSDVKTNSDSALDVTLWLSGNNMTQRPPARVELGANSEFIGAIYAPDAFVKLASNFNIYGSIMCGFLDLSSFGELHFDEALLYDGEGTTGEYEPMLWRRLPRD